MFLTEMAAARFVAGERVTTHQFAELEEISDPSGALERLIERLAVARDIHILPKFLAQLGNARDRLLQAGGVARHAAFVPEKEAEFAME